jgi:hypothetical protein
MKRIVALASLVAALSVACTDERVPSAPAVSQPMFEIKDGHVGGNPKFFFLFPIRRLADDAKVPSTGFNPDLAPVIEVYECAGTSATGCVLPLGARKSRLTMGGTALLNRIFVLPQFKEYAALWDTRSLGLLTDRTYRIQVLVGGEVLGFADVDVVRTLREAASVNPNDFVPLLQNLILPIRFWIGVTGNSKPIDLALGGTVVLATTGDRVTIPPQGPGKPVITVTVQPCTDAAGTPKSIDVDLPTFGNCLRVTTDPEIATDLSPKATVSICSLLPVVPILPGSQKELLTLHRQKGAVIQALPHAPNDFCPPPPLPLGSAPPSGVRGWAAAGWRWAQQSVAALIGPRRLYAGSASREASTALLDVGEAGGLTPLLSDFQFALPAKMDYVVPSDASRTAPVGNLLTQVMVTDARNGAVAGAKVTFRVPAGESPGTILATALSNAAGIAQVQWPIVVGTNTLIASGRGIATPSANGPAEGFDPFTPPVDPAMTPAQRELQVPVTLLAGTVTFTATGSAANLIISSFTRSRTDPTVADDITFTAVVKNVGTDPAPASRMSLRVGGETFPPSFPVPALAPGATFTVTRTLNLNVAQGYFAEAKADIKNDVVETNETDNNALMFFAVTALTAIITDATGDAATDSRVPVAPDLASASATVDRGSLTMQLRFAPGTFDQTKTIATVVIDIDQNPATGFPGVDAANNDRALIGAEYNLQVGSASVGSTTTLLTVIPSGGFSSQKVGTITYVSDGANFVIPLLALGNDRGEMNFKVIVQTQISFPPIGVGYTGIVDYMTNLGLAAGMLTSLSP